MKLLLTAVGLTFIFSAFASQKIEKIFEDESLKKGHITLFLSDGEIVHFEKSNRNLLEKSKNALMNSSTIVMNKAGLALVNTADKIVSLTILSSENKSFRIKKIENPISKILLLDPLSSANLTILDSYTAAQTIMDTFNGQTDDDSQCYNRAHMWTYEASFQEKINLGKLWIFFTHKYIRDYEYKWWFHVSPYASVADQNRKYVLDRGFTQVPFNVKNWKNLFIKNKANCPIVTDYLQYENNQEQEYCYLIYSSQHFWQPYQLKNFSTRGNLQTKYNGSDLKIAYNDALTSWDGEIPGIDSSSSDEAPSNPPVTNDSNPTTIPDANSGGSSTTIPHREYEEPTSSWVSVGESVINTNGFEGRVTGILSETRVEVRFANSFQSVAVSTHYLAVKYGSSLGFKVGDYVKNNYFVKGKVTGIFQDGSVTVKFRGAKKHSVQDPRNLTRRLMVK